MKRVHFLALHPYTWGGGESVKVARKNANANGGSAADEMILVCAGAMTVDGLGMVSWPSDCARPVVVSARGRMRAVAKEWTKAAEHVLDTAAVQVERAKAKGGA